MLTRQQLDFRKGPTHQQFGNHQRRNGHQPANGRRIVGDTTTGLRRLAGIQVGKKRAVIRLGVSVWVRSRIGSHKGDVVAEKQVALVASSRACQAPHQDSSTMGV